MINRIYNFVGSIYNDHGYIAALIGLIVLVGLVLAILWVTGIDLGALLGLT